MLQKLPRYELLTLVWFRTSMKVEDILESLVWIVINQEQNDQFLNAQTSHIFDESNSADNIPVLDQYHLTDNYRGLTHLKCNLNYRYNSVVLVLDPAYYYNTPGFIP